MDCETVREMLPQYVSRSIGQREASTIAAHLASCPHCRRELVFWVQVSDSTLMAEAPDQLMDTAFDLLGLPPEKPGLVEAIKPAVDSMRLVSKMMQLAFRCI